MTRYAQMHPGLNTRRTPCFCLFSAEMPPRLPRPTAADCVPEKRRPCPEAARRSAHSQSHHRSNSMRRTEDRVRFHWQRDQLALRMIRHGARSSTVSAWTGLSANRICTLVQQSAYAPHRGQPPRRVGYFFRTPLVTIHAATLGNLFYLFEILSNTVVGTPAHGFRTLGPGEKLCHVYEIYVAMVESPLI